MNEYVISREELRKWCSVPVEELANHPDRKMELMMGDDKKALLEQIGNMITDEVIANNEKEKIRSGFFREESAVFTMFLFAE